MSLHEQIQHAIIWLKQPGNQVAPNYQNFLHRFGEIVLHEMARRLVWIFPWQDGNAVVVLRDQA